MIVTERPTLLIGHVHDVLLISSDDELEQNLRAHFVHVDDIEISRAAHHSAATHLLRNEIYDVVLLDIARTAVSDLSATVEQLHAQQPGAAVIIVLDERDPDLAAETVRSGAQDVLIRGEFTSGRLAKSLRLACIRARSLQVLEEAVLALEVRNSDLDQFACTVGHDLRSPIRTARALAELADRRLTSNPAELGGLLHRIEDALDRLDTRVSALLRLARVGRTSVERRRCAIEELVEAVRADLSADLVAAAGDDPVITVRSDHADLAVDPELFTEVLQNLVSNALTHGRPGIRPVIEITSASTRAAAVVTVTDNGPGIATEDRERAMQMFERLSGKGDGTGMGLALCRRIVEAHDGLLWLEDRPDGPGLHVRIWIPHLRVAMALPDGMLDPVSTPASGRLSLAEATADKVG